MSITEFLSELQRRHVVRAAVAHIIVFWLLVQVADVVLPYVGIVDEPVRWALTAGIALFPVTLIVAWFFEHPWHRQTRSRLFLDVVVIAVVTVTAGAWLVRSIPQVVHTRTSLAVLPFAHSGDSLERSLSQALAYEINSLLMKSRSIDVTGHESANSKVLEGLDGPAVAETLGVEHVLDGRVSASGPSMRIELSLIDRTGRILLQQVFEDSLDNLFSVQETIAAEIAERLGAGEDTIPVETVSARRCWMPADPAALEKYYTARYYVELRTDTEESRRQMREAIAAYRALTEQYPRFAEAWSGLAWALMLQRTYDPEGAVENPRQQAVALAREALEHCPDLGEALHIVPNRYDHENPWIAQYRQLTAFIEAEPQKMEYLQRLSRHLREAGLTERALEVSERNYALDPLSPRAIRQLAAAYQYAGRFDEAIALEEQAAELGSTGPRFASMAKRYHECGDDVDCRLGVWPMPEPIKQRFRAIVTRPANEDERQRAIAAARELMAEVPHEVTNRLNGAACAYDHLTPVFFEVWRASREAGSYWFWPNVWRYNCDNVWTSPAFPAFLDEAMLIDYWHEAGWPAVCRPEGDSALCGLDVTAARNP